MNNRNLVLVICAGLLGGIVVDGGASAAGSGFRGPRRADFANEYKAFKANSKATGLRAMDKALLAQDSRELDDAILAAYRNGQGITLTYSQVRTWVLSKGYFQKRGAKFRSGAGRPRSNSLPSDRHPLPSAPLPAASGETPY